MMHRPTLLKHRRCCRVSLAALLGGWLSVSTAHAHFFTETASCRAPAKPAELVTEADIAAFERKVQEFQACTNAFIDKQNEAMEQHRQSAQAAADAWQRFAEKHLQPPAQQGGS